jgi:hypothetical protein
MAAAEYASSSLPESTVGAASRDFSSMLAVIEPEQMSRPRLCNGLCGRLFGQVRSV